MEVDGYAPPAAGTLSLVGGNGCNSYCVDDGVQAPSSSGHTEVLTTQACADLCDQTSGCFAFEYHPWQYFCRLDSTTLDLSGETELRHSTVQYYYEKLTGGGHAVAPFADTSAINTACPGAAAGQVVPRSCGAACADVFMPWWSRCSEDAGVMAIDMADSNAFTGCASTLAVHFVLPRGYLRASFAQRCSHTHTQQVRTEMWQALHGRWPLDQQLAG